MRKQVYIDRILENSVWLADSELYKRLATKLANWSDTDLQDFEMLVQQRLRDAESEARAPLIRSLKKD